MVFHSAKRIAAASFASVLAFSIVAPSFLSPAAAAPLPVATSLSADHSVAAELIWPILVEQADDMGEKHPLAMIASFNTARQVESDATFKNLLAWYALEEAGRYLADRSR